MKASSIVSIIFLLLFLGINLSAHAQSGASMSYTIVITDNTIEHGNRYGDDYDDRGLVMPVNCIEQEKVFDVVKEASVELQAEANTASVKNIYKLKRNFRLADFLANVDIRDENGSLVIVMEYN